jgi:NADH dehydrogenase [ubiquinone] 1 alpha subcomplex assembly factor 7
MGRGDRTVSSPSAGEPRGRDAVDPVLRSRLSAAADSDGFLRFDRYVEIALYDAGRGFYDRPEVRLGRSGDFYTAAHVHELFGATLAAHLREIWRGEGAPSQFQVVEVGPGDGVLAADIRAALRSTVPESAGWEYVLIERSSALRSSIEERLRASAPGGIPWRFVPSLTSLGAFRGVLLANELLDAFPFRRLERSSGGWAEQGILVSPEGSLRLTRRPPGAFDPPENLPDKAPEGLVLEVSPLMEAWIRELSDHLAAGRAVLIDYGDEESRLMDRVGSGTLEAIRGHRSVDPLSEPGTADLSAWVNFTRLRAVAGRVGLREMSFGPLADELLHWGLDDVRARMEVGMDSVSAVKLRLAQKSLLLGFGSFKVLELAPALALGKGV